MIFETCSIGRPGAKMRGKCPGVSAEPILVRKANANSLYIIICGATEWIGIGAGICTSVSLVPQLIKIIKTKKAENISYFMLAILIAGLAGWVWYGTRKKDIPIIVTNTFAVFINLLTIIFSAKYKNKE